MNPQGPTTNLQKNKRREHIRDITGQIIQVLSQINYGGGEEMKGEPMY